MLGTSLDCVYFEVPNNVYQTLKLKRLRGIKNEAIVTAITSYSLKKLKMGFPKIKQGQVYILSLSLPLQPIFLSVCVERTIDKMFRPNVTNIDMKVHYPKAQVLISLVNFLHLNL